MKSPQGNSSLVNLKLAKSLIRCAHEDLKNDPKVRQLGLWMALLNAEASLVFIINTLESMGYKIPDGSDRTQGLQD